MKDLLERKDSGIDVALIGRERWGDENLSLRYLATALKNSGHRPHILPLNGPGDLERATAAVLRLKPPLAGISISDSNLAIDAFALVNMLRRKKYDGHITAGGVFATLTRFDILRKHSGIDSIVRHDGEIPIVKLADAFLKGSDLETVPGLTTRGGDGLPAPVTDPSPMKAWPLRRERLPEIMGMAMARILASRGCPGQCPYCAPAALRREAAAEALRGGVAPEAVRKLGIGGRRRRALDDIADEMSFLYREKGARFFNFLDDNFLPAGRKESLELIEKLSHALKERRIGKIALALLIPAAIVSEEIVHALAELGMIKAVLGIESFDRRNLEALHRGGNADIHLNAIDLLVRHGILTLFNSLLIHPSSTVETVEAELQVLEQVRGASFEIAVITVHNGSRMWRKLCREGRIDGDFLLWRFRPESAAIERLRASYLRLRWQGFEHYDAALRAHDVGLALALGRRFGCPWASPEAGEKLQKILHDCNNLKLMSVRRALEISKQELPIEERIAGIDELVMQVSRRSRSLMREIEILGKGMERAASMEHKRNAFFFSSCLAASFALCLAGTAGGCYRSSSGGFSGDASRDDGALVDEDINADEPLNEPSIEMPEYCADPHSDALSEPRDWGAEPDCVTSSWEQYNAVQTIAWNQDTCRVCLPELYHCYYIVLDETGRAVDVRDWLGSSIPEPVRRCYLEALQDHVFPCLAGDQVEFECYADLL